MPPQTTTEEAASPPDETVVAVTEEDEEGGGEEGQAFTAPAVPGVASPPSTSDDPWRNRNVILTLLWGAFAGVADSIWGNTVLSGFLLALAQVIHSDGNKDDDNTLVGTAEAVQGLAMLISALPVGLIADWFGKARVVAYGGVLFVFAIAITLIGLWKAKRAVHNNNDEEEDSPDVAAAKHAYQWMLVALVLWGIGVGVVMGPAQALFADSIPQGQRSAFMMWQHTSYLLSSMVGPIVGVIMLARRGADESWSLSVIYNVFVVGVLLEIPGVLTMFFFSDKYAIVEEEETNGNGETTPRIANTSTTTAGVDNDDLETPLLQEEGGEGLALGQSMTARRPWRDIGKAAIPYVLFTSSLVGSLGAGASVKYFPLFFGELGFSSAFVQGIYVIVPLSISLFSFVGQRASKTLGRIETTVLFEVMGESLLFSMTWLSRHETEMSDFRKYLIIAVYLLRTGLMNAGYPLLESVLMDALPSNQRARWKSLESVAAFGWTGSALVGGVLADERSYRFTFAITAALQVVGTIILLPLQPFVEPETASSEEADGEANTPSPESEEDQD